jgi:hypothetical protein
MKVLYQTLVLEYNKGHLDSAKCYSVHCPFCGTPILIPLSAEHGKGKRCGECKAILSNGAARLKKKVVFECPESQAEITKALKSKYGKNFKIIDNRSWTKNKPYRCWVYNGAGLLAEASDRLVALKKAWYKVFYEYKTKKAPEVIDVTV